MQLPLPGREPVQRPAPGGGQEGRAKRRTACSVDQLARYVVMDVVNRTSLIEPVLLRIAVASARDG
jgi:hypothetical protein